MIWSRCQPSTKWRAITIGSGYVSIISERSPKLTYVVATFAKTRVHTLYAQRAERDEIATAARKYTQKQCLKFQLDYSRKIRLSRSTKLPIFLIKSVIVAWRKVASHEPSELGLLLCQLTRCGNIGGWGVGVVVLRYISYIGTFRWIGYGFQGPLS